MSENYEEDKVVEAVGILKEAFPRKQIVLCVGDEREGLIDSCGYGTAAFITTMLVDALGNVNKDSIKEKDIDSFADFMAEAIRIELKLRAGSGEESELERLFSELESRLEESIDE